MIECPACGHRYRAGTLFCDTCGISLLTGRPLGTKLLSKEELPASQANFWDVGTRANSGTETPTAVHVTILETGRQVGLPVAPEILVGRLDAARGVLPDLDLTSDGGIVAGVSRRHAKIRYRGDCFSIEDLGSANGTFVNGKRLTPYLSYPLRAGDRLQIGGLEMVVEFDYASPPPSIDAEEKAS